MNFLFKYEIFWNVFLQVLGYSLVLLIIWLSFTATSKHISNCSYKEYDNDTLLLANLMYSECSLCDISEKLLTGSVGLNRLNSGKWGNTLEEVLYAPNQFHGTCTTQWKSDSLHYQLARILMTIGPIDNRPLYFYQTEEKKFTKDLKILYREKYHIFSM